MPFQMKKVTRINTDSLEKLGDSVVDFAKYTESEFDRLASALQATEPEHVWTTAPPKPRTGTLAYADGVHWNPGSGEGFYDYRSDGVWHYLEVPPYVPPAPPPLAALVLLETISFAGAASYVSSASWAGYSHIKLMISNLSASSSASNTPNLLYHANGAYQTSSYVSAASTVQLVGTPVWATALTTTTALALYGGNVLDTTNIPEGVSIEATIFNVNSTIIPKHMSAHGVVRGATNAFISEASGVWNGGNFAIDGCKLQFSGGANLIAGKMQIYGML